MLDGISNAALAAIQIWLSWQSGISVWANILLLLKGMILNIIVLAEVTLGFWVLFVAGMNIQRVYEKKVSDGRKWYKAFNPAVWFFAGPAIVALVIVDVLFRYTYGVVIYFPYFRGFFHDYTLSNMLNAILATPIYKGTWRYKLSKWIAVNLINEFSYDGRHIRLPLESGWGKT
jgi:hypothetical protein